MSKYRQAAKIDTNQPFIVNALREISGVTVQVGMDDILVGYKGVNYWIEIKDRSTVSPATGQIRKSAIKRSQHKLLAQWKGQYNIVHNLDQILRLIGVTK